MSYLELKQLFIDLGLTGDKIFPLLVLFLIGLILINRRLFRERLILVLQNDLNAELSSASYWVYTMLPDVK